MSREFHNENGVKLARWGATGEAHMSAVVFSTEIPILIAWLQEGPPKKRWRIMTTFPERPVSLSYQCDPLTGRQVHIHLVESDLEEVTE